jgi:hypothetical protein
MRRACLKEIFTDYLKWIYRQPKTFLTRIFVDKITHIRPPSYFYLFFCLVPKLPTPTGLDCGVDVENPGDYYLILKGTVQRDGSG